MTLGSRLLRVHLVLVAGLLVYADADIAGAGGESPRETEVAAVSRLDSRLDSIVSGVHWCRGDEEGFYRVIAYSGGIEEAYQHIYIQLLRVDSKNHEVLIDRTVPVAEAQGFDLVFSNLKLVPATLTRCADALVEGDVLRRSIDGQRTERFRMRVNNAGEYQVTFETGGSQSSARAEETPKAEKLGPGVTLESREMAALVVAYEDYRVLLKGEGIHLTLAEFVKQHHAIWVRREGTQIHIYFHPATELTLGGGVRYLVDAEGLQVTERIGER